MQALNEEAMEHSLDASAEAEAVSGEQPLRRCSRRLSMRGICDVAVPPGRTECRPFRGLSVERVSSGPEESAKRSFTDVASAHQWTCVSARSRSSRFLERIATIKDSLPCSFRGIETARASQRQILVDRNYIYQATLPPLNRILPKHSIHPAYAYMIALHSLNTISRAKKSKLVEALKSDPGLEHPTLFEIMPQQGLQSSGLHTYDTHFLYRLQRFTWVRRRHAYMESATSPQRTPFFLFGLDTDVLSLSALRTLGVDPQHEGRMPDILMIDLTSRARNRLDRDWQRQIRKLLDLTLELYLDECPPVLAVTDDPFMCDILRHDILREHDKWRSPNVRGPVRHVRSEIALTLKSDPLNQEVLCAGAVPHVRAEVYGTDILRMVEKGLRLRRSLLDVGEDEIGEAVGTAVNVIQNILGIPGQPRQFHEFLATRMRGTNVRAGEHDLIIKLLIANWFRC